MFHLLWNTDRAVYEKANRAAKIDRCNFCSTYLALHREPL